MSDAPKLTKKQKKAAAFRDRKGKGKAKPHENVIQDIPLQDDDDLPILEADVPLPVVVAEESKRGPTSRKKRQREELEVDTDKIAEMDGADGSEPQPKAKRRKKEGGEVGEMAGAAKRFILFLGNLKYTTSKDAIIGHFSSCDSAPDVRLLTPKPKPGVTAATTTKSKGCAFLEFSDWTSLQQGLRLHHSVLEGRKINVELTAGGGGKSETRLAKVKERNKELHGQRNKQAEKSKKRGGETAAEEDIASLTAGKRYSATSGVEEAPTTKRTWTVGDVVQTETHRGGAKNSKKRGQKRKVPKNMASGMNAIPVG